MRNISFGMTVQPFLEGTKDVTRRVGWKGVREGESLMGCEKCMGVPAGQLNRLGAIWVCRVSREPLERMLSDEAYGWSEVVREGFPDLKPVEFVEMFCEAHRGCEPFTEVTRIVWKHQEPSRAIAQVSWWRAYVEPSLVLMGSEE